jgi:putative ABC transport system substrate-binding protein
MKTKILVNTLAALILTTIHLVEAQQQAKVSRIGFLGSTSRSSNPTGIEAFRQGLRDLGYVEGKKS